MCRLRVECCEAVVGSWCDCCGAREDRNVGLVRFLSFERFFERNDVK